MDWEYIVENFHFANKMWVVLLPCLLMAADVLTGLTKAWSKNDIKSSVMRSGLAKKVGELFAILIAELFTVAMALPQYIVTVISLYICLMELYSNIENIREVGVPIPGKVDDELDKLKDELKPREDDVLSIEHSADDDRDLSPKEDKENDV